MLAHGQVIFARDIKVRHAQKALHRVQVADGLVHSSVEGRDHCRRQQGDTSGGSKGVAAGSSKGTTAGGSEGVTAGGSKRDHCRQQQGAEMSHGGHAGCQVCR